MKCFILTIAILCVQGAHCQLIDVVLSPPTGYSANIRDVIRTSDGKLLMGVDNNYETASIVKMSDAGVIDWAKTLTSPEFSGSYSHNVVQKSNGNYYLHGLLIEGLGQSAFLLEIAPSGTLLFAKRYFLSDSWQYSANKMTVASNGDLIFMASQNEQIVVFRTDHNGNLIWGKSIMNEAGMSGKNPGFDLSLFSDGSMVVSGKNENSLSLIKLSGDGTVLFVKNHLVGSYSHAKAMVINTDDDILISGDADYPFLMEVDERLATLIG